jgi:hypothetical protein
MMVAVEPARRAALAMLNSQHTVMDTTTARA